MKKTTSFTGVYYQRYNLNSFEDDSTFVNMGKECHIDIYESQMTITNTKNSSHRDIVDYPATMIEMDVIKNTRKILFFSIDTYILTLILSRDTDDVDVYKFKVSDEYTGQRVINDLKQFRMNW